MSQTFVIQETHGDREWVGKHGEFIDYYLTVGGYDERVVLTQKPESRPPLPGHEIYGHITVFENQKKDGTPFTVHKLKKEFREENGSYSNVQVSGPQGTTADAGGHVAISSPSVKPADSGGDKSQFWAAKDKRIARAGVVQALITSQKGSVLALANEPAGLASFVRALDTVADAVLASLDKRTPHPNDFLPTSEPTATTGGVDSGQGGASRPVTQTPEPAVLAMPSESTLEDEVLSGGLADDDEIPF